MSNPSPFRIHRIDADRAADPFSYYGDGDVIWHVATGQVLIAVADPTGVLVPVNFFAVGSDVGAHRRPPVPEGASVAAWWRTAYGGRYAASYRQAETLLTRAELDTNDAGCANLVTVTYAYGKGGILVHDPDNADTVTVFNGDGCNEVTVTRTKAGKWRLVSSDYHCDAVPASVWERRRYATPGDAVAEIQTRTDRRYIEVADWVTESPAAALPAAA